VLNNVINGRYGHGISILYPNTKYNLIDGNQISNIGTLANDRGKNGVQVSGGSNNTFRRNVFYNLYNRGIEINAYSSATSPIQNNWFYNNTFYNIGRGPANSGSQPWILCGIGGAGSRVLTGNKFYNNIADRVGQNPASGWVGNPYAAFIHGYVQENDAGDTENEVINNSNFNGNILKNNTIRVFYNGSYQLTTGSAIHYNSAQSNLQLNFSVTDLNNKGSNSGNTTADPQFASSNTNVANWWHLQDDSDLIDKGTVISDPNASTGGWAQLNYSGSAPDIGAYESGGDTSIDDDPTPVNNNTQAPKNLRVVSSSSQ
jgi:hypothetical protein